VKNSPEAEKARNRWRQSPRARECARKGALKALRIFAKAPKCGARKREGGFCENPGIGAGGRCRLHGGATPSGDNWHRPVFPEDARRFANKIESLRLREEKRLARVAAMTPEERERYERRRLSFLPGTKAARAAAREKRRQDEEARDLLAKPGSEPPPDREEAALEQLINKLKSDLDALERQERERQALRRLFE
jgi:hypothetical protein